MGQNSLSPSALEMSIAQEGLHSLDLHSRRHAATRLVTPQLWALPGPC